MLFRSMILLCTPPGSPDAPASADVVRSFFIPVRQIGERPSPFRLTFPVFVGTESPLTDISPRYNRPLILNEQELAALSTPFPTEVKSLALLPIQRRGRFAGCFLVSSQESEYFSKAHCQVVYEYGVLMALAFRDQDFYPMQTIKLAVLPSFAMQHEQEAHYPFRLRVEHLRKRLGSETASPNQEQLETLALQELEQHLIDL